MRAASRLLTVFLLVITSGSVVAQEAKDTTEKPPGSPFFTWKDAVLAAGFVGGTFAVRPLDKHFAQRLQDSTTQTNRFLRDAATGFRLMGQPIPQIVGVSMYAVGRLTHHRRIAQLGLHGTEAFLTANVITTGTKFLAGRARPRKAGVDNPHDYKFGRGFSGADYQSFPSGHATTAFAVASAVTAETSHWWPRGVWVVGPVMYGGASMVGVSRMFNNAHWASDVVFGAAIGTFSGIKVVRYNYRHPKNKLERTLLAMKTVPGLDGSAIIGWTISTN
jgi:hypothetical protein